MSEMKTLGGRALAVRKDVGKTQKEMASFLGVATATWQKIERDEGLPSGETLLQFGKLGINPGWVLSGLGPKRLEDDAASPAVQVDAKMMQEMHSTIERMAAATLGPKLAQSQAQREVRVVPRPKFEEPPAPTTLKYFPTMQASAGAGRSALAEPPGEDLDAEALASELLGIEPKHLYIFPVKGDSMLPTLSDGDIAIVDRRFQDPDPGEIYVASVGGDLVIKRAHWEHDRLSWVSDNHNANNPPIEVIGEDQNTMKVMGKVVWGWRRL